MNAKFYIAMLLLFAPTTVCAQVRKSVRAKVVQRKDIAVARPSSGMMAMTPHAKALYEEMLPNTQMVFVIDSVVVDRKDLFKAIPLPEAYGKYVAYDTFFGKNTGNGEYVYVNGFGNRCYYTELGTDSVSRLYVCDRVGDAWGTPQPVQAVNDSFTDIAYPFMSSDGQTLYFSGVSAEDGLGRHDIYMTKYNADGATFLKAENIGLPFNSAADDLAYIVADADGLAWFASARRQPDGKVCVYTFVPTDTRQNYSSYGLDGARLESLANLTCIRETWPTPEQRDKAMERLAALKANETKRSDSGQNMRFVVNDRTIYTNVSQFKSDETRRAYYETVRLHNDLEAKVGKLEAMRATYHAANAQDRVGLGRQIVQLEQQVEQARLALKTCESGLRQKESKQ